jgi:hypothetical protein
MSLDEIWDRVGRACAERHLSLVDYSILCTIDHGAFVEPSRLASFARGLLRIDLPEPPVDAFRTAIGELVRRGILRIATASDCEAERRRLLAWTGPRLADDDWQEGVVLFSASGFAMFSRLVLDVFGREHVVQSRSGWRVDDDAQRVEFAADTKDECARRLAEFLGDDVESYFGQPARGRGRGTARVRRVASVALRARRDRLDGDGPLRVVVRARDVAEPRPRRENARVTVENLARKLSLGSLLSEIRASYGPYDVLDEWQQGEFHHDVVLRVRAAERLPGEFLVVATNCNGGVKEVLSFASRPERGALWHWRCPSSPEFTGDLPPVLAQGRTIHWFDPCDLLQPDARSEIRAEHRERQPGGGWKQACGLPKRDGR